MSAINMSRQINPTSVLDLEEFCACNVNSNQNPTLDGRQSSIRIQHQEIERRRSESERHRRRNRRRRRSRRTGNRRSIEHIQNTTNEGGNDIIREDSANTHNVSHIENENADFDFSFQRVHNEYQSSRKNHTNGFVFALISCTLGVSNISRISVLTIHNGVSFLLQFVALSILFGIPFMTFCVSLGQHTGAGFIKMWNLMPIFRGIGVALLIAQSAAGVCGIASISWMFYFFRDSFSTKQYGNFQSYLWSFCFSLPSYRRNCGSRYYHYNNSWRVDKNIPDYFAGTVLGRSNPNMSKDTLTGHLNFETVFNMFMIWLLIIIAISRGIKSYRKIISIFVPLSIAAFVIFVSKTISFNITASNPSEFWQLVLGTYRWDTFLFDRQSWFSAVRECFLTWGFFGASMTQIASHNRFKKRHLFRDVLVVVVTTIVVLTFGSILGIIIDKSIRSRSSYTYVASSFESLDSYVFLNRLRDKKSKFLFFDGSSSIKMLSKYNSTQSISSSPSYISLTSGIRIISDEISQFKYQKSGYQILRLVTELVPIYATVMGPRLISPFWIALFYFSVIIFGLAQQFVLWRAVSDGIVAISPSGPSRSSYITFFICFISFLIGLPLATEAGIYIFYFLDYVMGSLWWLVILHALQMLVVLNGNSFKPEKLSQVLNTSSNSFFMFLWNCIIPLALLIFSVLCFKHGQILEMFNWKSNQDVFPSWLREIGSMLMLLPLLTVPFIAIIHSFQLLLYIADFKFKDKIRRILMRYSMSNRINGELFGRLGNVQRNGENVQVGGHENIVLTNFENSSILGSVAPQIVLNDPPPSYTPPPSYSTAVGKRISRLLRQSFRRQPPNAKNFATVNSFGAFNNEAGEVSNYVTRRQKYHDCHSKVSIINCNNDFNSSVKKDVQSGLEQPNTIHIENEAVVPFEALNTNGDVVTNNTSFFDETISVQSIGAARNLETFYSLQESDIIKSKTDDDLWTVKENEHAFNNQIDHEYARAVQIVSEVGDERSRNGTRSRNSTDSNAMILIEVDTSASVI